MTDAAEIINTVRGRNGTYLPKTIERNERLARGVLPKVMRVLSRVPFADDLLAAYYAARDPLTPVKAKAILFAAVAYFVMPADAIPDVLAVVGFTDDAAVFAALLAVVGRHLKPRHRAEAKAFLERQRKASDES